MANQTAGDAPLYRPPRPLTPRPRPEHDTSAPCWPAGSPTQRRPAPPEASGSSHRTVVDRPGQDTPDRFDDVVHARASGGKRVGRHRSHSRRDLVETPAGIERDDRDRRQHQNQQRGTRATGGVVASPQETSAQVGQRRRRSRPALIGRRPQAPTKDAESGMLGSCRLSRPSTRFRYPW